MYRPDKSIQKMTKKSEHFHATYSTLNTTNFSFTSKNGLFNAHLTKHIRMSRKYLRSIVACHTLLYQLHPCPLRIVNFRTNITEHQITVQHLISCIRSKKLLYLYLSFAPRAKQTDYLQRRTYFTDK